MSNLTLPDRFPLPGMPTELSPADTMFEGTSERYLAVGLSALDAIEAALIDAPPPASILDLPCGHGRVTRILRARYPDAVITACDLDKEGVDFCARTFDAIGVVSKPEFRDLDLGREFDLIWVGSLLTHLPEISTRQFLDFALRHMGTTSRLVVTTHGASTVDRLRSDTYRLGSAASQGLVGQYLQTGYGYRGYEGSPAYGISVTDRRWFEALLAGSSLRLESYQARGWDRHQDVLVLRRVGVPTRTFEIPGINAPMPGAEQSAADAVDCPGFEEQWYRRSYPDVAEAIADQKVETGLQHYLAYGWSEGRLPFDPIAWFANREPAHADAWVEGKSETQRVDEAWSTNPEEHVAEAAQYWMAHPTVRARSNLLASGNPSTEPYAWFSQFLETRGWTLPIGRSVSIGCGFGALERHLVLTGLAREIDAFDLASGALVQARREARRLGLDSIRYHLADLDRFDLPERSIDVVFAHASVHHVERLEALYATVRRALRPGGVFHLHEFVGPTRFQWTDAQLALGNHFLDSLPPRLRRQADGTPKPPLARPTIEEMIAADPSESVRSSELVACLEPHFDILEYRPLGGALAHLALGGIVQNFKPDCHEDERFLAALFQLEAEAMARGEVGSDFAIIIATPKRTAPSRSISSMKKSPTTARMTSMIPAVRRLYDSVNGLVAAVGDLHAEQSSARQQISLLRGELTGLVQGSVGKLQEQQARLEAELKAVRTAGAGERPMPTSAEDAPPADGRAQEDLDRATRREMGEAALRHLPFLPGVFEPSDDGLTIAGYCGAPDALTGRMAFFVNGRKIEEVEYPIEDPELKSRFPDVPGMGLVFRAHVRDDIEALHRERFWRFDSSRTGRFHENDWRRAVHYMNPAFERFPFPPTANIKRVIGDTSVERFAMGGATIFHNAQAYLREMGYDWPDFPQILDWGCGAGRLTRYLVGETGREVTGVDIDADNVAWCQQAYAGGSFRTVPLRPRTDLEDGRFDLVFGLSVMTHLQEDDQFLWLEELQRITRRGALLLLSIQGPTQFAYNRFPPDIYRRIQRQGYIDLQRDDALAEVVDDKEYYRSAMQSRPYIVREWGRYFDVIGIEDAIAGLQDFVVLRRR